MPRALAIALGKDFFGKNPENFFAEGQGAGPRQRFLIKKIQKKLFLCRGPALSKQFFFKKKPLPRALAIALGKDFFGKNPENIFAEGQGGGPRQRFFLKKIKKNYLPRAGPRQKKLKKKPFLCRGSALGKETANGAGA